MRQRILAFVAALSLSAVSGCGTFYNLQDPVQAPPDNMFGLPTRCEPFGGVQRSIVMGALYLGDLPKGLLPSAALFAIDTPLSLIGDVATLPIVLARKRMASDSEDGEERSDEWKGLWLTEEGGDAIPGELPLESGTSSSGKADTKPGRDEREP